MTADTRIEWRVELVGRDGKKLLDWDAPDEVFARRYKEVLSLEMPLAHLRVMSRIVTATPWEEAP